LIWELSAPPIRSKFTSAVKDISFTTTFVTIAIIDKSFFIWGAIGIQANTCAFYTEGALCRDFGIFEIITR
jgi:hypothetical protein